MNKNYKYIINPKTNYKVLINSDIGRQIFKKYMNKHFTGGNKKYKYLKNKLEKYYNKNQTKKLLNFIKNNEKNKNFVIKKNKIYINKKFNKQIGGNLSIGAIIAIITAGIIIIGLSYPTYKLTDYGYRTHKRKKREKQIEKIYNKHYYNTLKNVFFYNDDIEKQNFAEQYGFQNWEEVMKIESDYINQILPEYSIKQSRNINKKQMIDWISNKPSLVIENNSSRNLLLMYLKEKEDRVFKGNFTAEDFLDANDKKWGLTQDWKESMKEAEIQIESK